MWEEYYGANTCHVIGDAADASASHWSHKLIHHILNIILDSNFIQKHHIIPNIRMQASFERDGTGISSSIGDASSTFTGDAADDASRVRSTARHDETVDNVSLDEEAQNGGAGQEIGIDAFKTVALADELKKVEVKEEGDTEEGDKEEGDKERLPMGLRCFGIGLVVLLILVAIFLGIYFGGDRKPRSNEPNEEIGAVENEGIPTGSPSTSTYGYILDALDDYADAEVLTDPTTPQGQAFLQLVQEEDTAENRPTPVFTVGQRYALMTLYLSTEPSAWMVDNGWDGFVGDECTWYGVSCEGSVVTNVEICKCMRRFSSCTTITDRVLMAFLQLTMVWVEASRAKYASLAILSCSILVQTLFLDLSQSVWQDART